MTVKELRLSGVDPLGPVFVSYRHQDGTELALQQAWTLRSAGLPVWHDQTDQPPGDLTERLSEALRRGLSAAVLVVTPDITNSKIVRQLELPKLLALSKSPEFNFLIANAMPDRKRSQDPDFGAPDRLLRRAWQRPRLKDFKQYPFFNDADAEVIALSIARRRMSWLRKSGINVVDIDLQTRDSNPGAWQSQAALVVRLPTAQPTDRAPTLQAWGPYAAFLNTLPSLLGEAGTRRVLIRGQGHLSAAAALGAALPLAAVDLASVEYKGETWADITGARAMPISTARRSHLGVGHIAVMVDCADGVAFNTFNDFVQEHEARLSASLTLSTGGRHIEAADAAAIADGLATAIKEEAREANAIGVDLCIRAPFPLAFMLGRRMNLLEVRLFEWEAGPKGPRYVPALTVAPGRGALILDTDQPQNQSQEE